MDSSTQGKFGVENRVQKATIAHGKVVTRANTRARRVLCDIGNVGSRSARQSNEADDVKAEKSKKQILVADRPVPRKFGINITNNSSTTRVSSSSLQGRDGKGNVRQKVASKSIKLSASVKTNQPLVVRLSGSHKSAIGKPPRVSNSDIPGKPPKPSTVGFSGKPPRVSNLESSGKCTLNTEVQRRPCTASISAKQASSSADSVPKKPPRPSNDHISGKENSDDARVKKVLPSNTRVVSRKNQPADASKRKVKPQRAFTSTLTAKLKVHPTLTAKAKVVSGRIKPHDVSKRKGRMRKSFTSTLTTRSEASLGLSQPERIEGELSDIDESDYENQLAVADYVHDIYHFYWDVEARKCPSSSYMSSQLDITPKMRAILVDWLIDVHLKFELMPETLFLMTNLLDRFLSIHVITRKDFQLVGLTALLIASKYEEIWPPKVEDLLEISKNSYTHDQMLSMEKLMLNKLRFNLTVPTSYVFLKRFLKAAQADEELENLSFYLIELCLVEYESLQWKPSMLAASATFVAQQILQRVPPWTRLLQKHAHYMESELKECATMVARFHLRAEKNDLQVVRNKYLGSDYKCVAMLPCVRDLLSENSAPI